MGLDPHKISLIRTAPTAFRWPLFEGEPDFSACVEGRVLSWKEAAKISGVKAIPARGWVGHCEMEQAA
jgi:hypothetical protein